MTVPILDAMVNVNPAFLTRFTIVSGFASKRDRRVPCVGNLLPRLCQRRNFDQRGA